ncbi:MAG: hypothetical protein H7Y11_11055 [Armatimonadetes bacterium]|nr:hypothetical protein [Anaerolineae bacterium]
MSFLRRLFGGGGTASQPAGDKDGLYFYVRPKRCDEIVVVRVNSMNDPSQTDDGNGYFIRKVVRATRCPFEAELLISFDNNRRITDISVQNGENVTVDVYQAWLAARPTA